MKNVRLESWPKNVCGPKVASFHLRKRLILFFTWNRFLTILQWLPILSYQAQVLAASGRFKECCFDQGWLSWVGNQLWWEDMKRMQRQGTRIGWELNSDQNNGCSVSSWLDDLCSYIWFSVRMIVIIIIMKRWSNTIWRRTLGASFPRSWRQEDTPF